MPYSFICDETGSWELGYDEDEELDVIKERVVATLDKEIARIKAEKEAKERCTICELTGSIAQPYRALFSGPIDVCLSRKEGDVIIDAERNVAYIWSSRGRGGWCLAGKAYTMQ